MGKYAWITSYIVKNVRKICEFISEFGNKLQTSKYVGAHGSQYLSKISILLPNELLCKKAWVNPWLCDGCLL